MDKNRIIVIPFSIPWDWSTDYTNQTAFVLSKSNIVICYMWCEAYSIKEYLLKRRIPKFVSLYSKNLYLFYPTLLIPFRRFRFMQTLNDKLMQFVFKLFVKYIELISGYRKKILWLFYPNLRFMIDLLGREWKVVYDCVDFFAVDGKENIKKTKLNEARLCKEADLVVANSLILQKYLSQYSKKVKLVPQGFRLSDFDRKKYIIKDLGLRKPVIGFVGALGYRLDYDLLIPLASRNRKWNFVVWGPVLEEDKIADRKRNQMREFFKLPNVVGGLSKNKKEIPGLISQFDIGMIPYDISLNFNKYCYPMKVFEYFFLGKPVVSTDILELRRFPQLVKIGKNYMEWEGIIEKTLATPWPKENIKMQKKLSMENSWENKVKSILTHLQNV